MEIKIRYYDKYLNFTSTIVFYSDDFSDTKTTLIVRKLPLYVRNFFEYVIQDKSQNYQIYDNTLYVGKLSNNISILIGGKWYGKIKS